MTLGADYFREEAKRYRERAATETKPQVVEQWRRFARQYESLADMVEDRDARKTQEKS